MKKISLVKSKTFATYVRKKFGTNDYDDDNKY